MDNDIEEVIRPLKIGLNNYGYCHNHDAAYRSAMIYSFIATCNKADVNPREWLEDIMPRVKGVAPDDFAALEMLLPGEWKKTHPDSHSMVHHTTEEEHVAAILKSRAKRKAAEQESTSNIERAQKPVGEAQDNKQSQSLSSSSGYKTR